MDNDTSTAITSREFYPYWTDESVRFADLDPLGHVYNAAISTYFESARVALFSDSGNSPVSGPPRAAVSRSMVTNTGARPSRTTSPHDALPKAIAMIARD